jgi:hypothetical protein
LTDDVILLRLGAIIVLEALSIAFCLFWPSAAVARIFSMGFLVRLDNMIRNVGTMWEMKSQGGMIHLELRL